jgi:MFS family permease
MISGTLLALAASNLLLLFFAAYTPYLALAIFFIAGCACGGYMVTNVVFILEAVRAERTRLLVASLNGWPIGMVFTGLIAYLCREWRWYCGTVAGVSACLAGLLVSIMIFDSDVIASF